MSDSFYALLLPLKNIFKPPTETFSFVFLSFTLTHLLLSYHSLTHSLTAHHMASITEDGKTLQQVPCCVCGLLIMPNEACLWYAPLAYLFTFIQCQCWNDVNDNHDLFMFVCMCMCMCMYVYVCVCMCMYVCVYMCVCVYVCMCVCVYVCLCVCDCDCDCDCDCVCVVFEFVIILCMYVCCVVSCCSVWCACNENQVFEMRKKIPTSLFSAKDATGGVPILGRTLGFIMSWSLRDCSVSV
jgi:hypothetical protein